LRMTLYSVELIDFIAETPNSHACAILRALFFLLNQRVSPTMRGRSQPERNQSVLL
jgi:hypothetical protein